MLSDLLRPEPFVLRRLPRRGVCLPGLCGQPSAASTVNMRWEESPPGWDHLQRLWRACRPRG